MVTGFDIIGHNKPLQEHWLKRFVGALIDWIVISIPTWFFGTWFKLPFWIWYSSFVAGLVWMFYSAGMETAVGTDLVLRIVSGQQLGTTAQAGDQPTS